jgi:lysophospholipase
MTMFTRTLLLVLPLAIGCDSSSEEPGAERAPWLPATTEPSTATSASPTDTTGQAATAPQVARVPRSWNRATDLVLDGLPGSENELWLTCARGEPTPALQILCHFYRRGDFGSFQGAANAHTGEPVRIDYVAFRPDRPARAAIVIVNGLAESYLAYAELVHDLTVRNPDLGYAVYLYDHRGQGFSDRLLPGARGIDYQRGYVDAFDNYVADLETFLEQVVAADGQVPVFGFAHSMGGAIATAYLQAHPDDSVLSAVVLSSPMHQIPGITRLYRSAGEAAVQLGLGGQYAAGKGPWKPAPFGTNPNTRSRQRYAFTLYLATIVPQLRQGGPTLRWGVEALAAVDRLSDPEACAAVKTPVLVLSAEHERLVGHAGQKRVCEQMPDCRFELVRSSRHSPFHERDVIRGPFLDRMVEFFEARLTALHGP